MNLDLSTDFEVWDDLETIQLVTDVAPQDGQETSAGGITAMRRAPTYKELAASNGAYTAKDLVWEVPAANVSAAIKPGDQIIDGSGTTWTVLEAPLQAVGSVYTCMTRDLILAYQLRDSITVEQSTAGFDADGAATRTWAALYSNVVARVQPEQSEITTARGFQGQQIRCRIFLSQQLNIDVRECRVLWTDVQGIAGTPKATYYLDLQTYQNAQRIDELPYLDTVLNVDSQAN